MYNRNYLIEFYKNNYLSLIKLYAKEEKVMEEKKLRTNIIYNLFWKFLERGGTQGIQFLVQILLARLLTPEDYGTVALIIIFIQISNVFIQSGFNTALIQKKDADHVDFSTVFYFSLFVALILYMLLFFSSPLIAKFYNKPIIVPVVRWLSLTLFFGAISSIQNAVIAKNMEFKKLFYSSLVAMCISSILALGAAYSGLGVWAIVIQQLSSQILVTAVLWYTVKWRPILAFSFKKLKSLFSYGSKILASTLIETFYNNVRGLIIGKIYTPAVLGYYNRGQQFPSIIITNINGSIQSVMLPVMSSEQDDLRKMKLLVRRSISVSSFLVFPIMVGLAIIAEPLVILMLTDKWLPAVPFLQIYCISYAVWPLHTANLQAISALGRSDIFLVLEILKKTIGIIIMFFSIKYGVYAIAVGEVLSSLFSTLINAYPNKNLLSYGLKEQLMDMLPSFVISVIMGVLVFAIGILKVPIIISLLIQLITGVVSYVLLAKILKLEVFLYLSNIISNRKINEKI